jgi:hypothetical protein
LIKSILFKVLDHPIIVPIACLTIAGFVLAKLLSLLIPPFITDDTHVQQKYGVYPNARSEYSAASTDVPISYRDDSVYIFPGSKIDYIVAVRKNIPFGVDFQPVPNSGFAVWYNDVVKINEEGGPSSFQCQHYNPLTGQSLGGNVVVRCPDRPSRSELTFRISDNLALIGERLTFVVKTFSEQKQFSFIVSDKRDFAKIAFVLPDRTCIA